MSKVCVLCETELVRYNSDINLKFSECVNCGRYAVDSIFSVTENLQPTERFELACVAYMQNVRSLLPLYIARDAHCKINRDWQIITIEDARSKFPKVTDIVSHCMLNIAAKATGCFECIKLTDKQKQLISFCSNGQEHYFFQELNSLGYIDLLLENMSDNFQFRVTLKGWQYIEELKRTQIDSQQVFVAMWFDSSMDDVYTKAISPAIIEAGFEPLRIDGVQHNNKICDEIVSEIKQSRFLVADFSGNRGGVYYEAGLAHGLGLPVIWLVEKADIENLHFDTRQYNHIVYDKNAIDDLEKQLFYRIKATI